jgi:hypothetical protein
VDHSIEAIEKGHRAGAHSSEVKPVISNESKAWTPMKPCLAGGYILGAHVHERYAMRELGKQFAISTSTASKVKRVRKIYGTSS